MKARNRKKYGFRKIFTESPQQFSYDNQHQNKIEINQHDILHKFVRCQSAALMLSARPTALARKKRGAEAPLSFFYSD